MARKILITRSMKKADAFPYGIIGLNILVGTQNKVNFIDDSTSISIV